MAAPPVGLPPKGLGTYIFHQCTHSSEKAAEAQLARLGGLPEVLSEGDRGRLAVPVHGGWVLTLECRSSEPDSQPRKRYCFASYSTFRPGWRPFPTARQAVAHAGYAIRAETGRDCILTVTRNLVCHLNRVEWVAFACARSLSPEDRIEANAVIPLDRDLQGMAAGYLAGTTPAAVMLDYLADHGPAEFAERFGLLAGRFV